MGGQADPRQQSCCPNPQPLGSSGAQHRAALGSKEPPSRKTYVMFPSQLQDTVICCNPGLPCAAALLSACRVGSGHNPRCPRAGTGADSCSSKQGGARDLRCGGRSRAPTPPRLASPGPGCSSPASSGCFPSQPGCIWPSGPPGSRWGPNDLLDSWASTPRPVEQIWSW